VPQIKYPSFPVSVSVYSNTSDGFICTGRTSPKYVLERFPVRLPPNLWKSSRKHEKEHMFDLQTETPREAIGRKMS